MKKLLVLGLLLAATTGCGRSWFPHLFRGAPCGGLCSRTAPQGEAGCAGCTGAGYESYGAGDTMIGGETIGSAPVGQTYESIPPMMAPLPQGSIVAPR